MKIAYRQACKAYNTNEVPVGAVIVDMDGSIIGRGYNKIEKNQTQAAHAEMIALSKAAQKKKGWRLDGCTLYVTLEPCLMCLGGILLSRITTIVYGAPSPLFGGTHCIEFLQEPYRKGVVLKKGLQEGRCIELIQLFFSRVRSEKRMRREQVARIFIEN